MAQSFDQGSGSEGIAQVFRVGGVGGIRRREPAGDGLGPLDIGFGGGMTRDAVLGLVLPHDLGHGHPGWRNIPVTANLGLPNRPIRHPSQNQTNHYHQTHQRTDDPFRLTSSPVHSRLLFLVAHQQLSAHDVSVNTTDEKAKSNTKNGRIYEKGKKGGPAFHGRSFARQEA